MTYKNILVILLPNVLLLVEFIIHRSHGMILRNWQFNLWDSYFFAVLISIVKYHWVMHILVYIWEGKIVLSSPIITVITIII